MTIDGKHLALILALLLAGCTAMPDEKPESATVTELASCPSSPNCVCSTAAEDSHHIEPLAAGDQPDATWQALRAILDADDSIRIMVADERYIRAEATTRLLRFTDDIEFLLDRDAGVINMRSASRVGYSDLGKNRRRLERIRRAMP